MIPTMILGAVVLGGILACAFGIATVLVLAADALGFCYSVKREEKRHAEDRETRVMDGARWHL